MRTGIELFLHSSTYRKQCIHIALRRIRRVLMKPIIYVRAYIGARKFLKEHPDNWERYVAMKNLEKETAENDRIYKITELRMDIRHNLTQMQIAMLIYIAKVDPLLDVEKAKEMSQDEINEQFMDYKKKTLEGIDACMKLGAVMPEELSELIQGCAYDSCETVLSLRAFSEQLATLLEDFDFGRGRD